ncbi:MAG: hypothetical protein PHD51_01585 [Patescibacteria group bacterium]|nr:hypothetical protein [Patescibacteria group bacterium]MDD5490446.1 hypothetical protein [Patescibacteria group bacterium]
MDIIRTKKLMVRWSLLFTGLILAFWAIYYLWTGAMPVADDIRLTEDHTYYKFPFGIPRIADLLIGILCPATFIFMAHLAYKVEKYKDGDMFMLSVFLATIIGCVVGFILSKGAITYIFTVSLLIAAFCFAVSTGIEKKPISTKTIKTFFLFFALPYILMLGSVAGLISGVLTGLFFSITAIIGATVGIFVGILSLISVELYSKYEDYPGKIIASLKCWSRIKKFMLAK